MFGIDDEEFLKNGIKIIDGIAGGAKSSKTDAFFKSQNVPYARYTSTNRLRRDASNRYNMDVKTIAAGLFHNNGNHFYAEEKEPECNNIVIDEILQSSPKAIDWCVNHPDNNIIITTDSKQLLSPENELVMKSKFNDLKALPSTIYTTVTDTLRARDDKTRDLYNEFYDIADTELTFNLESLMMRFHTIIDYKDMEYNPSDAYITHDNLTEDFLYKDKDFINNPLLDLIPKGHIASRPPRDLRSYPILSQSEAEKLHARAYTQVMNVGSAVRFQGSEVMDTQKLYYLIQPGSVISARELYTVITRMWTIDSFVIVVCETPKPYVLKTFNGLPVKTHKYLMLKEPENFKSTLPLSDKDMDNLVGAYDTEDIYFDRDAVRTSKGVNIYIRKGTGHEAFEPRKSSAGSIARRDAKLNYSYMDKVYSILEKYNLKQLKGIHKMGHHDESTFELDVFSAHPTMLKFEKMPIDGFLKDDGPYPDMLNFYLYDGDGNFTKNSIITDDLKNLLDKDHPNHSTYLFSTPYTVGTFPGDWLYSKAHDTQESKKEIKEIHYGYYQKPYLKLSLMGDCYVRYENHIYELLICQIFSQLLYYMLQLFNTLNGTSIIIDAVQFPCYNEDTLEVIKSILPDYIDFRIRTDKDHILYQTYENLPTKSDKKKEKARERARKYRQRKKKGVLNDEQKQDCNNEC